MFLGRVVSPGEPQWLELDRDYAISYEQAMADVCRGCGSRRSLWDADDMAYVGQQDHCPGCLTLDQERKNIPEPLQVHTRAYLTPKELATLGDIRVVPVRRDS